MSKAVFLFFILSFQLMAAEYVIYGASQELPMNDEIKEIKKDYYVNIGSDQGVTKNTILNVYRNIVIPNSYEAKTRHSYKVKIGEMKVVHASKTAAIGHIHSLNDEKDDPVFDINSFIVGDLVEVNVGN